MERNRPDTDTIVTLRMNPWKQTKSIELSVARLEETREKKKTMKNGSRGPTYILVPYYTKFSRHFSFANLAIFSEIVNFEGL